MITNTVQCYIAIEKAENLKHSNIFNSKDILINNNHNYHILFFYTLIHYHMLANNLKYFEDDFRLLTTKCHASLKIFLENGSVKTCTIDINKNSKI